MWFILQRTEFVLFFVFNSLPTFKHQEAVHSLHEGSQLGSISIFCETAICCLMILDFSSLGWPQPDCWSGQAWLVSVGLVHVFVVSCWTTWGLAGLDSLFLQPASSKSTGQGPLRPGFKTHMLSLPLHSTHRPAQIQGVEKQTPLLDGKGRTHGHVCNCAHSLS